MKDFTVIETRSKMERDVPLARQLWHLDNCTRTN